MLLAEYVKLCLHRGKYYSPENLPAKVVAASSKEGKIDRRLAIPLEDLSTGWKKAGQIGQEVFGGHRTGEMILQVVRKMPSIHKVCSLFRRILDGLLTWKISRLLPPKPFSVD